jgi:Ring finger domain
MSLVLLVFLLTKCIGGHMHGAAEQAADVELGVPAPAPLIPTDGLSLTEIKALPSAVYPLPSGGQSVCPICLEDFSTGTEISILPCRHYYHPVCIEAALLLRSTCPYCSQTVAT